MISLRARRPRIFEHIRVFAGTTLRGLAGATLCCTVFAGTIAAAESPERSRENSHSEIGPEDILTPAVTFPFRRWDFIVGATLKRLAADSGKAGYSAAGMPIFAKSDVLWERPLGLFDKSLAQSANYKREVVSLFGREVQADPHKFEGILSQQTIKDYVAGDFSKNPVLADGSRTVVHHGEEGYKIVNEAAHRAKPHAGGNTIYGEKAAARVKKFPKLHRRIIMQRWIQFAAVDIGVSAAWRFFVEGDREISNYAIEAGIKLTAAGLAAATELALHSSPLFVTAKPIVWLTSNPIFVKGYAIGGLSPGGPAAWVAMGVYIAADLALLYAWSKYQQYQAKLVEALCREAESEARRGMLEKAIRDNSEELDKLSLALSE